MNDADDPQTKRKIYCNKCRQTTNHKLVGEHHFVEDDIWDLGANIEHRFVFWICCGCETGTLENSEGMEGSLGEFDEHGNQLWSEQFYPARARAHLPRKFFIKLGPKRSRIYRETIWSFNNGSLVLCTAGLRALLEGICDDKQIKGRNLKEKIDKLQPLLANENIIKSLHHFRFTGNEAVHQLESPKAPDLKLAIEVMEDLLNFLYELDYKASQLKDSRKSKESPFK
jgi:hypothetical protein